MDKRAIAAAAIGNALGKGALAAGRGAVSAGRWLLSGKTPKWSHPLFAAAVAAPVVGSALNKAKPKQEDNPEPKEEVVKRPALLNPSDSMPGLGQKTGSYADRLEQRACRAVSRALVKAAEGPPIQGGPPSGAGSQPPAPPGPPPGQGGPPASPPGAPQEQPQGPPPPAAMPPPAALPPDVRQKLEQQVYRPDPSSSVQGLDRIQGLLRKARQHVKPEQRV